MSARAPCCTEEDEQDPGRGGHRVEHRAVSSLSLLQQVGEKGAFSPTLAELWAQPLFLLLYANESTRGRGAKLTAMRDYFCCCLGQTSLHLFSCFTIWFASLSFSFLHPFSNPKPFPQAQSFSSFCPSPPSLFSKRGIKQALWRQTRE